MYSTKSRFHQPLLLLLLLAMFGCAAGTPSRSEAPEPPETETAASVPACCNLESPSYHHFPVLTPREIAAGYTFTLETEPRRPRAGEPARIALQITGASDAADSGLGTYPERRPHFLVVSENLEEIHHLHPEDLGDWRETALFEGRFTFSLTFSTGGRHWLNVEFLDRGRVVRHSLPLVVEGPAQGETRWDFRTERQHEGLEFRFRTITPDRQPRARDLMNVTVRITDDGRPVTELQAYAGALAHIALVRENGAADARHLHGGGQEYGHFQIQNIVPGYSGPKLYFSDYLGEPGRYRAFVQFQRNEERVDVAFDFRVLPSIKGLP